MIMMMMKTAMMPYYFDKYRLLPPSQNRINLLIY